MTGSERPLDGRKALVMAASRGIGRACAERFAAMGASLCLMARGRGTLEEAAASLTRETGAEVLTERVDVSDGGALQAAVARHTDADILLTNCGGPPMGSFEDFGADDWDAAYGLQVRSAVIACRALVPEMAGRGWGRVIMVTSVSVARPLPGLVLSNALRPGLQGLARTLTREYAAKGVTCNLVCPGMTVTDRIEQLIRRRMSEEGASREQVMQALGAAIPAGRLGDPREVGAAAGYLASPEAGFVSGQSLFIDGGQSAV